MEESVKVLAPGKTAPAFSAGTETGETIRLSQYKGQYVVLYFYPKDNTPGCTIEAKEFRDVQEELATVNAVVLGVSPDDASSHCKFIKRFGLNFSLITDETHALADKYGVWAEKNMYGKKFMGIERSTFLIDPKGKIAHVWTKVRAEGHAEQVLEVLENLSA